MVRIRPDGRVEFAHEQLPMPFELGRTLLVHGQVLRRCAEEAAFTVETLEYFCFRHFPAEYRTDGQEFLTLTARKPVA